jgi:acetyl-CoA acyltransferase 1
MIYYCITDCCCSTQKHPDDVVITLALRTPLTKGHKGGFKDTTLDTMVFKLLKETVNRMGIDPSVVEDICLGNVSTSLAGEWQRASKNLFNVAST